MKVLVVIESDYDCCDPKAAYLVPDDVDFDKLYRQWYQETLIPVKGKNQFGEWTSKIYGENSKTFESWLSEMYNPLVVEVLP